MVAYMGVSVSDHATAVHLPGTNLVVYRVLVFAPQGRLQADTDQTLAQLDAPIELDSRLMGPLRSTMNVGRQLRSCFYGWCMA